MYFSVTVSKRKTSCIIMITGRIVDKPLRAIRPSSHVDYEITIVDTVLAFIKHNECV